MNKKQKTVIGIDNGTTGTTFRDHEGANDAVYAHDLTAPDPVEFVPEYMAFNKAKRIRNDQANLMDTLPGLVSGFDLADSEVDVLPATTDVTTIRSRLNG